jgi:hypothetical protein
MKIPKRAKLVVDETSEELGIWKQIILMRVMSWFGQQDDDVKLAILRMPNGSEAEKWKLTLPNASQAQIREEKAITSRLNRRSFRQTLKRELRVANGR